MDREIIKIWSGPIADLPEEFMKEKAPESCVNVTVYSDGSRIYDKGFTISEAFRDKINFTMSRCWDSLSGEEQERINSSRGPDEENAR